MCDKHHIVSATAAAIFYVTPVTSAGRIVVNIVIVYNSSVNANPEEAAFKSAIQYVVNLYDNLFTNNVTVKIAVGWGEVDGQPVTKSAGSKAFFLNTDYATVLQALNSNAQSSVQMQAYSTLPTVAQNPFVGQDPSQPSIQLTYGNAKALGLPVTYSATTDPDDYDGWIGFNSTSSFPWSYDPNSTPAGFNDFIAAAEHEISEVLGRTASVGEPRPGNNNNDTWRPMDFFRYSAPSQRDLTASGSSTAYFSIDGGNTNLGTWNTDTSKDLGDWQSANGVGDGPGPNGNDAYDGYSGTGHLNPLTMSDLTLMNVIGWNTAADPANTVPNGVLEWVAAGQSADGMTVLAGGEQEVAGSASDTVLAGGLQQIDAGGGAVATTIEDGGKQYVDRGATARSSTIETGGAEYVVAGATIGTIIDGGTESVRGLPSGGVIGGTYIVGTAQQTRINSGTENVGVGGNAIATTIGSGTLEVARDGALSSLQWPALPPLRTQTYLPSVTFAVGGDGTLKLDASAQLLAPDATVASRGLNPPTILPGPTASASLSPDVVTVAGFGGNDKIDFADIAYGSHTTVGFREAANHAYGVLTVTNGTESANLLLIGQYASASFVAASDGHGGSLITDPPAGNQSMIVPPHG